MDFQFSGPDPSARKDLGQRRSVLVADDDALGRTIATSWVTAWGYDCVSAADGAAALEILTGDEPPTIAILDWIMPKMLGTEICHRIRSISCPHYIYFILISSRDRRGDSVEGLRSGADAYICKPLDPAELRTKLEVASRILFMEESLRDLHAETEFFINSVPSILIGTDAEGKVNRWNTGAQQALGLTKDKVEGQTLETCGISWCKAGMQLSVKGVLAAGTMCRLDDVPVEVNGAQRHIALNVYPLRNHAGFVTGSLLTGADITEKTILEDQLRQTQKLEAIGQLAAGIAHEINTPIQFVSDNVTFLSDSWRHVAAFVTMARALRANTMAGPENAGLVAEFDSTLDRLEPDYLLLEVPLAISQAQDGLQRVSKIVSAMRDFSHKGSGQKELSDINRAIQATVTVAGNEWKYVAEVETQLDGALPLVPCLLSQFNQAILNILVNAAHAIGDVVGENTGAKGRIVIRTRKDGDEVEVSISDNGKGIPEEIRDRVFEPFFTTKEVGKGTGQGLTLAYAIITKEHKGKIWFESEVGHGTTFFLRLPLAEAASAAPS